MTLTPLLDATRDGLRSGAPDIERLYDLGKRRQWNAAELPWASLDFSHIPSELRAGLGEVLSHIQYGELGALTASAKLVSSSASLMSRLFGATQVADEARHVEWFSRLLFELDCAPNVSAEMISFIDEVTNADDELSLLVGMNILIEGAAQSLMLEAGKTLRDISMPGFESLALVGTWLVENMAGDESRHLAFGIKRVGELVAGLDASRKRRVEEQVEIWARSLMVFTTKRSVAASQLGMDGDGFLQRTVRDTENRLRHAGLRVDLGGGVS